MTLQELEARVVALEQAVADLQARAAGPNGQQQPAGTDPATQRHWWRDDAGAFADDPGFEEMVRLGREYRESLHPDRQKKPRKSKAKGKKDAGS